MPSPLWFLDRSAGEVSLLLMTVTVTVGVLRAALPATNPLVIEGIHANLALLTIAFGLVHVVASIADPYAQLRVVDALLPFTSPYRTLWLGLGVIAGYVYAVGVLTSWPVRRVRRRAWTWIHRTLYLAWILAFMHSLATGSDTHNLVFVLLNFAAAVVVLVVFLGIRVAEGWVDLPRLWTAVGVAAVIAAIALGVWAFNGPLQPGWAAASGTPPDLLRTP